MKHECHPGKECFQCPLRDCLVGVQRIRTSKEEKAMYKASGNNESALHNFYALVKNSAGRRLSK